MITNEQIVELSARIAQQFRPERIILFGSYARGNPEPDSDVDLLIILPFEGKAVRKSIEILDKTTPSFPVDIIVRTPEQLRSRLSQHDFFLEEIVAKGQTLYEASHR